MRTVEILQDFTGYPDGETEQAFKAKETPSLEDAYAALLIEKGHARAPGPKLPVLPPEPAAARPSEPAAVPPAATPDGDIS